MNDCCFDQSSDYWVFASNKPFNTSLTPTQQAAIAGVWSSYQAGSPNPTDTVKLAAGTTARYVMVQHASTTADYLSLTEVQVFH